MTVPVECKFTSDSIKQGVTIKASRVPGNPGDQVAARRVQLPEHMWWFSKDLIVNNNYLSEIFEKPGFAWFFFVIQMFTIRWPVNQSHQINELRLVFIGITFVQILSWNSKQGKRYLYKYIVPYKWSQNQIEQCQLRTGIDSSTKHCRMRFYCLQSERDHTTVLSCTERRYIKTRTHS